MVIINTQNNRIIYTGWFRRNLQYFGRWYNVWF